MPVDVITARWLSDQGLTISGSGPLPWADASAESVAMTPFVDEVDALAELGRQIAFLGPARVIEQLRCDGDGLALLGQTITITADADGYRNGADVFVIAVDELDEGGAILKVIRRLT